MGVGRNASSSGGPIRGYLAQGTQPLARRRIGQASSCRRGDHGPYRRVETRPLLHSQRKTTQRRKATCTETDKLSCPDFFPVALQWLPGRELHPQESSAFHGALLRQLRVELFPMRFSLKVEGCTQR